jgi:hypothetical protein
MTIDDAVALSSVLVVAFVVVVVVSLTPAIAAGSSSPSNKPKQNRSRDAYSAPPNLAAIGKSSVAIADRNNDSGNTVR